MSSDPRAAIGHANYPGHVVAAISADIESGRPFGPNYMGEQMWPVTAVYSLESDSTRVGFSLVAPVSA